MNYLHWKILLLRVASGGLALILTASVTPKVYFVNPTLLSVLFMAVALGVLNALIKPIIQFLTLPLLFASFGLVLVLMNTVMLYLLAIIFPNFFAVESLLWGLVAGAVIGLVGSFLENLLGITRPILPDEETELRRKLKEEEPGVVDELLRRAALARQAKLEAAEAAKVNAPALPEAAPPESGMSAATESAPLGTNREPARTGDELEATLPSAPVVPPANADTDSQSQPPEQSGGEK